MTNDIRKRLFSLKYTDSKVRSLRREITSLRTGILKSQQYSDEPKSGSLNNKAEDLNIQIIDKTNELYDEIDRLLSERDELVKAIEALEDPIENIVMRLLYINGYSWKETERELRASSATIQRARDKAITKISKMIVMKVNDTF